MVALSNLELRGNVIVTYGLFILSIAMAIPLSAFFLSKSQSNDRRKPKYKEDSRKRHDE